MPGVQSLRIPLIGVSCGLPNPFHFYSGWPQPPSRKGSKGVPAYSRVLPHRLPCGQAAIATLGPFLFLHLFTRLSPFGAPRHRGEWTISSPMGRRHIPVMGSSPCGARRMASEDPRLSSPGSQSPNGGVFLHCSSSHEELQSFQSLLS